MTTLIIPCAGKSTRFNLNKPKGFLTHPAGDLMLIEGISGLGMKNVSNIIIIFNQEQIEESKIDLELVKERIKEKMGIEPVFIILNEWTSSQAETIYAGLKINKIVGSIFIKDCDNYFSVEIKNNNSICVSHLTENINPVNKSYVSLNKFGELIGIVEKQIIGNLFSCGGYSFNSAEDFIIAYEKIIKIKNIKLNEIYISHIVQQMLLDGELFKVQEVENYSDWGTLEDWLKYCREFKTIFADLDGVLVGNGGEYFDPKWGETEGIKENIEIINKLYESGKCKIIITTARPEKYREKTIKQLEKYRIKYHSIIFGLPHSQRILINDYAETNPYPSASAINLKRNEDNLKDYL